MNSKLKEKIKRKTELILIKSFDADCNMESQFLSYYTVEFSNMWDTVYNNVREPVADVIDDVLDASFNNEYYISIIINLKSSVLKSLY